MSGCWTMERMISRPPTPMPITPMLRRRVVDFGVASVATFAFSFPRYGFAVAASLLKIGRLRLLQGRQLVVDPFVGVWQTIAALERHEVLEGRPGEDKGVGAAGIPNVVLPLRLVALDFVEERL